MGISRFFCISSTSAAIPVVDAILFNRHQTFLETDVTFDRVLIEADVTWTRSSVVFTCRWPEAIKFYEAHYDEDMDALLASQFRIMFLSSSL